jgi:predicted RNA-binding Zn-ribbon protein involved in translation (DUF1610 family)
VSWKDDEASVEDRAKALLDAVTGRAEAKRLGQWLDASSDVELRSAVVNLALARGADVTADDPGKKLLRKALIREGKARRRENPIRRDEAFVCAACGLDVAPHGRTARDHCPYCLHSLHVDVVPGDRAAICGGIMQPVGVQMSGDRAVLSYECKKCGYEHVNQALTDGAPPDDWEAIVGLAASAK